MMAAFRVGTLIGALFLALPGTSAERPHAVRKSEATFVTLGTGGGPVIKAERGQPANAVVVNGAIYLFDIGAGTQQKLAQASLNPRNVKAVFLSHHHIDHVADLGPFLATRWVLGNHSELPIFGPRGTANMASALNLAAQPIEWAPVATDGPENPPIGVGLKVSDLAAEMPSPIEIFRDENVRVLAVANRHYHYAADSVPSAYSRSYSFRIETRTRSFVYTGDTGWSEELVELAQGADLLISEVIDMEAIGKTLRAAGIYSPETLQGLLKHMAEDHLTPRQVGKLASIAGVKQVVLTHLVPGNDGERDLSGYLEGIAEEFSGDVEIASDLSRW